MANPNTFSNESVEIGL